MAMNVEATLRTALKSLQAERDKIHHQVTALRTALGDGVISMTPRGRRRMSAAARKAVSRRMKAYWAKRRAAGSKAKAAKKA